jgi:predicted lysophospholipase L1 biosynthesis ABC-type transport system permease subunit
VARLQGDAIRVDTLAIEDLGGEIRPQIVGGRAPTGPDEVLLGGRTMRDLGVELGDTVSVGFGATSRQLRIVGRGVLPEFAGGARFGEGAAVTFEGMRRIVPDAERDVILLRLGPGADPRAVALSDPDAAAADLYLPSTPSDLADLERVDGSPSLVAGLLGVLAIGTLTHALVTSVRRQGRTLAVLKSVGCVRRQIFSTVVAQSTVLVGVALIVGLPLGVAAGRAGWQQFAAQLGVQPEVRVPFGATVVLVPVAVLLAGLIAVLPARAAARTRPAALLRDRRP